MKHTSKVVGNICQIMTWKSNVDDCIPFALTSVIKHDTDTLGINMHYTTLKSQLHANINHGTQMVMK